MIAVVKYNAGNVHSVLSGLSRIGADAILTDDADQLRTADKVIFPGVGEASSAMAYLKSKGLDSVIKSLQKPFLGICLGMQLMCARSEEGNSECLGIFPETVARFPEDRGYKVPHMGWNTIKPVDDALFYNIPDESYVYFVHSYYVPESTFCTASAEYDGISFSAALHSGNFYGVQFHPEKSGRIGEQILRNFVEVI